MAANNNNNSYALNNQQKEELKISASTRINNPPSPIPIKHRNDAVQDTDNNNNKTVRSRKPTPSRGDEIEGRNSIAMMHPSESISSDPMIDAVLRYATEHGYVLEIEKESRGVSDEVKTFELLSVFCPLPVGSDGKVTEVQLLFNLQMKSSLPEIIICDERISMTPGFLDRIGFHRIKSRWDPSQNKALYSLLEDIKNGILSLNQLEFEQKLSGLLNQEVVASYVHGEAIAKAVKEVQGFAANSKHVSAGAEVNLKDFEKNLMEFRHYINCSQKENLKTLQLFQMSFSLDYEVPEKQLQVVVLFFPHCFEIRLKPSLKKPTDPSKVKFDSNFCYDFMQQFGGFHPEDYRLLTQKIENLKHRFAAMNEGAKFRKKFLNRLLQNVCEYGALYDLDINEGYKLTVLVKIKSNKILLVTIQLGDLFPLDYVKVVTKKFQEATGQSFTSVNQFVQRKIYCYEANGQKVKSFQDEELHATQAADILQFMKEIIADQNSKEGWNHSYF